MKHANQNNYLIWILLGIINLVVINNSPINVFPLFLRIIVLRNSSSFDNFIYYPGPMFIANFFWLYNNKNLLLMKHTKYCIFERHLSLWYVLIVFYNKVWMKSIFKKQQKGPWKRIKGWVYFLFRSILTHLYLLNPFHSKTKSFFKDKINIGPGERNWKSIVKVFSDQTFSPLFSILVGK